MKDQVFRRVMPFCAVLMVGLMAGFALGQAAPAPAQKVVGLGGVFFKSADPKATATWYQAHLGVPLETFDDNSSARFKWTDAAGGVGYSVWAPFKQDTKYFAPSSSNFMVNFVVRDLDAMVKQLNDAGVPLVGKPESYDYGKFAWIMDPEGRKVELYQPVP